MSPLRYLLLLIGLISLGAALTASFAWIMDPYGVCHQPVHQGLNQFKTGLGGDRRLKAAWAIHSQPFRGAIFGSSRAGHGLDPRHPFFDDARPALNLALDGTDIYETRRLFEEACRQPQFTKALIGLDFFAFNVCRRQRPGRLPIQDGPLDLRTSARIFSIESTHAAFLTLIQSQKGQQLPTSYLCQDLWSGRSQDWVVKNGGHKILFENYRKGFFTNEYAEFALERDGVRSMDDLQAIITLAHTRRIKLTLFFSPSHAELYQVMQESGLHATFLDLKKQLAELNARLAKEAGAAPFPLWDFAYNNHVTAEPVPTDANASMTWYWELSHYKKALGDRVMQRFLTPEDDIDFGRRLLL